MFEFLNMIDDYEDRKIANYNKDGITVDTCAVSDSEKPYETGIRHPAYNRGDWIIVELYDTKSDAQIGHNKWVDIMTNNPPRQFQDVSTCVSANILRDLDKLPPREKSA